MVDFFFEFQLKERSKTGMNIILMFLGFVLIDISPGIAYFLWFQDKIYFGPSDDSSLDEKEPFQGRERYSGSLEDLKDFM